MPTVAALFARTLTRAAGLELSAQGDVLEGQKVLYSLGRSARDTLPDHAYFKLIEWLQIFRGDAPDLVFAYANTIRDDDLGPLGLAMKSAPTLRDSLQRLERYFRLITDSAVYQLDETSALPFLRLKTPTEDHPALNLRDECAIAAVAQNIRAFGDVGIALEHVSFAHSCRSTPPLFQDFFGCDVRFEADQTGIAIAPRFLSLPNRLGDAAICDFLTQHLDEELLRIQGSQTLRQELSHHLSTRLSDGVPQASCVAMQLGMSERTFFRRLADEGTSFREVLRDAQLTLAQELLADGTCSIAEVAFLTGFSEQSTFSRAFKRWVGAAPAQFRQRAQ